MERISVVMDADAALAALADSSFIASDAVQNTIVKMSLESFCKHITLGGRKKLLLLTKLREQALQMNDVFTETWHLIQLYCWDYFEKAASAAENHHGLDMLKWDAARDGILTCGNGSGFHALRNSPPSPTTGLWRRFLAKAHKGVVVIDTPEHRSSKRCSRCGGEVVEDPTRTYKRVHKVDEGVEFCDWVPLWGIHHCNSAICGGLCRWNRDHNAAINIRANLLHYLNNGTWPQQHQHQQHRDVDETTTTITAVGNLWAVAS
jgi:hypothetical protein